jgi:methylenetetrahydrofolate--tRNA-(uracil-5-)-methyltransferase
VTARLMAHPRVTVETGEITALPRDGPLDHRHRPADIRRTLAEAIRAETGAEALAFFDAIAPIVYFDSVDMEKAVVPVAL